MTHRADSVRVALPLFQAVGGGSTPASALHDAKVLHGLDLSRAKTLISQHHYTRSIPSGKSHFIGHRSAIIVWSVPANKNCASFLLPGIVSPRVWELSRLWAPDGHEPNLLTAAIRQAVRLIVRLEKPDALVSYADPNAGHHGGVYRAASWRYHGQSDESRVYERDGVLYPRRAFHSGSTFKLKCELESEGFRELKAAGKHRFVRPISDRARRLLAEQIIKDDKT